MPIVQRGSVRANLTFAILITLVLSWLISSGVANYLNFLTMRSFHQEMLKHPEIYSKPIPEPKFGIVEFLTGRPPFKRHAQPLKSSTEPPEPGRPLVGAPDDHMPWRSPMLFEVRGMVLRFGVALALAALAGAWLARKFTRPLTQLAKGADAFQSGNLSYRIPNYGKNEFAAVAVAMNEMAEQVSRHIDHLERDAQRRRQFLADIAHEFRSPVTTMRAMAGALQDGVAEEPERRNRAVSALVGTSERLLRLVQDLMELAKLDLDDFPLNMRQVDLRNLVESVVSSHEAAASAAGVVLHPLSDAPSVRAEVDPDRITQVLDNIIQNAISYAGEGAEISVSLQDSNPVQIVIKDTGKGIRDADMPYVLDPFYRADAARTPSDCHTGLGLSIACRLIQAHGGQLAIFSEEGKGTTVTISFSRCRGAGEGKPTEIE